MRSLTDRQRVLFGRLVTLASWAESGELPCRVLEIVGFGSFFRGKPRPKDVDLIFRIQRPDHTPQFARFLTLLNKIQRSASYYVGFETPKEAMITAHRREDDTWLPGLEEGHVERARFGEWIDGHSWNMLRGKTILRQMEVECPEYYVRRMVKRRLPNLNIAHYVNPNETAPRPSGLRCGFTVSIWSEGAGDTESHLSNILSQENVVRNVTRELAYFDVQLPLVESQARLMWAEVDLLRSISRRRKEVTAHQRWFDEICQGRDEICAMRAAFKKAQHNADQFDMEEWTGETTPSPTESALSLQDAISRADTLRLSIKEWNEQIDLLEELRNLLLYYKSGAELPTAKRQDFVASQMLDRGSHRRRRKVALFLQNIGFSVP
ncbi:MAG: hypothetical protein MPJ50_19155 [Pirellulales bacterium]|nr:hypothetical protein [Pirellulales bacterium]